MPPAYKIDITETLAMQICILLQQSQFSSYRQTTVIAVQRVAVKSDKICSTISQSDIRNAQGSAEI